MRRALIYFNVFKVFDRDERKSKIVECQNVKKKNCNMKSQHSKKSTSNEILFWM